MEQHSQDFYLTVINLTEKAFKQDMVADKALQSLLGEYVRNGRNHSEFSVEDVFSFKWKGFLCRFTPDEAGVILFAYSKYLGIE